MNRRLFVILGVASTVGLLAAGLVYRTLAGRANAPSPVQPVVVAVVDLPMGETVSDGHVKLVDWPKASVPVGAVERVEAVRGRVVRAALVAGEPLLEAKLAAGVAGRGGIMPVLVPEGRRAVSIRVDDAIKESGFILPGSRVDILVSMTRESASQERVAKVVIQDIPVLAAGQTVEMRDNKPVQVTTVTLALTPEEGERLTLAQAHGRLTLAMRNVRDHAIVQTPGATAAALFGATGVARALASAPAGAGRAAPKGAAASAEPPEATLVAVIRGSTVSEQWFARGADQRWHEQPRRSGR
jgi:pilus assembly protein CpaB